MESKEKKINKFVVVLWKDGKKLYFHHEQMGTFSESGQVLKESLGFFVPYISMAKKWKDPFIASCFASAYEGAKVEELKQGGVKSSD